MLEEYEKKEPIIYRQISNSIKNGLSHAYLFELNDNIYAYEMIMSFVKKVLSNGDDNVAKRIDDGNYPELKHIFPDGQLIRKEQLEELQKSFSTISLENDKRFYIIHDSEKLNVAAANSLLKFLEEPSDGIIAILLTNNINLMLKTIVSRCQILTFSKNKLEDYIKFNQITSDITLHKLFFTIWKNKDELNEYHRNFVKKVIEVLSNLGVKLLTSPEVSRLSFDDCKNLVLELNNILMKINISVNPYTLIKMLMLGYVEKTNNFNKVSIEKVPEIREKNKEVKTEKIIKKEPVNTEKNLKVDIRINNCFVDASKKELERMKNLWSSFINNMEDAIMKGTLSDTIPVASSNDYTIIEVTIPHKDVELNNMLEKIEYLFNSQNQENFKFVFIDETRWSKEKVEYINNIKNGKKYEILEENQEKMQKSIDVFEVADIFDINKIEVE